MKCPCCGHPIEGNFPEPYFLPPQQRAVMEIVGSRRGAVVPTEDIIARIYQQRDEPDGNLKKHVSVLVCKLNRRMGRQIIAGVRGATGGFYLVTDNG